jgi:prolyl-tRNA editing enzyme YbaK/EbsC (Cys-tRNA(Pro) deacylase)
MTHPVWERLRALLAANGIAAREVEHAGARTADEAAASRGTPLAIGGKAILLRPGDAGFVVCALSAATELDSKMVRKALGVRRLRFATPEELLALTALVPGTVPPFGEPVLPFPLYADTFLTMQPEIAFTAGRTDRSLILAMADYLRIAQPRVLPFARPR